MVNRIVAFVFLIFSLPAAADYGWIPKYETLFLRVGVDYFTTGENFGGDGSRLKLAEQNQPVHLDQYHFWVEPEYGIADGFSVYMHANYLGETLSPVSGISTVYASGGGTGDIYAGVKWNFYTKLPTLTFETRFKIPTYSYYPDTTTSLVEGDGDYSIDFRFHAGLRIPHFFMDASPGFIARFAGYPSQVEFHGMIGGTIPPMYILLFTDMFFSLGQNLFLDSSLNVHDAPGSGGSYALLSGGPNLVDLGIRIGVNLTKKYYLEAAVTQALYGQRAPNFFQFTLNLFAVFDFFKPDPRKRIREIPLNSPSDMYWEEEKS
jgi:hypothetical protein